jgi:putative nucleotidyltransferase with HDIG domain
MKEAVLNTVKTRFGRGQAANGRYLDSSQQRELERFGGKINKFGVNFAVYAVRYPPLGVAGSAVDDAKGELVLLCEAGRFESVREHLIEFGRQALNRETEAAGGFDREIQVYKLGERQQVLAVVLRNPVRQSQGLSSDPAGLATAKRAVAGLVALVDLGTWSVVDNVSSARSTGGRREHRAARTAGRSEPYERLAEALSSPARASSEYLVEMLRLLAMSFRAEAKAEEQIEKIGTELSQVYEEIVLLHRLSTNMKVTEADTNFLQMACDNLTNIVSVEGIAILLEKLVDDEKRLVIAAGSGLIDLDERAAGVLYSRLADEISSGKEVLLDSEVDSPFKYEWRDSVRSIIAVPLYSTEKSDPVLATSARNGSHIMGLMVAINRIDKDDFDSTDVKLFNSVANGCAVFIENGRLFKDLEELFIGSLKALTRSIDAKDKYTRGHSERVAFIARWIAEKLNDQQPLEEEQLHKVYLAGLLHDIGKIGIDEVVLRKQGKLTEKEMECIKKHPSIGAGILREIKQMREIVPGVLYHHERVDGKGYPNGLVGDEIPLIGKIIGLADSFDAITSKRTYRGARNVEQAIEEIKRGLGTQFDEKIGTSFINSDVFLLWDIIMKNSPDFIGIYDRSDFAGYGAAAVGTLIR